MKNKDYELSKLKHEILFQNKGKEFLIRKLKTEEAEYISRFALVEPYLYEIRIYFSPTFSPKGKPAIIKDLYFNYWRKNKTIAIKSLKKNEKRQCDEMSMRIRPYKYKIWPNK